MRGTTHRVGYGLPEGGVLRLPGPCGEAKLAARNECVGIVKVGGADCPPGAVQENLQCADRESVDVFAARQPQRSLLPCTWLSCS